jgi:hypothetical protein
MSSSYVVATDDASKMVICWQPLPADLAFAHTARSCQQHEAIRAVSDAASCVLQFAALTKK